MAQDKSKKAKAVFDLNDVTSPGSDVTTSYKLETTTEQHSVDIEPNFESGTLNITPDLAKNAVTALTLRIDATKQYTQDRVERIDENFTEYWQKFGTKEDAQTDMPFPETFNAVEDWVDDLSGTFVDLVDHLEVKDPGDTLEEFLVKSLEVSEADVSQRLGFWTSLIKMFFPKEKSEMKSRYYFQKLDAIKQMMKYGLNKSGFDKQKEEYFLNGVVSGMFVFKEGFGGTSTHKLKVHDQTSGTNERTLGNFDYEIEEEQVFQFNAVDPRNLIFRKDSIPWMIEKVNTNLYSILDETFDAEGKPMDTASYDKDMVKKVIEHFKLTGFTTNATQADMDAMLSSQVDSDGDGEQASDIWDIDGDIIVYEAHHVPMVLPLTDKDGKVKHSVVKSMMTFVQIGEGLFVPIRIQPTPYYQLPYKIRNFFIDPKDVAGRGLVEVLKLMQDTINNLIQFSVDLAEFALWGVLIVDPNYFEDVDQLGRLNPRDVIKAKVLNGDDINSKFSWLRPPTDALAAMNNMLPTLVNMFRRTSRKGPTGDKITPNPSATEFESIAKELTKSVNRVVNRIESALVEMLEDMYIYTLQNRKDYFSLKIRGARLRNDGDELDKSSLLSLMDENEKFIQADKLVKLTPNELFVNGIEFKLKVVKDKEKEAVEKQQSLQMIDLLQKIGALTDPNTGQPKVFVDDSGAKVVVDEYKLLDKVMHLFDFTDIWTREVAGQVQVPPEESPGAPGASSGGAGPSPSVAPIGASPKLSDIVTGVFNRK